MRRVLVLLIVVSLCAIAAACGDGDGEDIAPTAADRPLIAGQVATTAVTLAGTPVDIVFYTPTSFTVTGGLPVLLAFPPGGQDLALTQELAASTYAAEAERRGWVVVSPAAPPDGLWFDADPALIEALIEQIRTWFLPPEDTLYLAGVSNGGLSAFHAFAVAPAAFAGLVAYPGYARADDSGADTLAALADVPVRLWVGGADATWLTPMQTLTDELTAAGGDITLEVVAGEGHIIGPLRDGVSIFDALEAMR